MRARFLTLFLLALLAALAAAGAGWWWLHQPLRAAPAARVDLSIEPGTLPRGVAQAVRDAGVDVDRGLLYAWFRLSGQAADQGRQLRAGARHHAAGACWTSWPAARSRCAP